MNNIILTIKCVFKILFSKNFWKYVIDGITNIPNNMAKKLNNKTNEINKVFLENKKE